MKPLVRLSKSFLGIEEKEAICRVVDKGFLGMGKEVHHFENELKQYLGGKVNVACVNSGTAALQLALQALDIGPGDEVLVPSLTYVASFQAISATGAIPIACDVEVDTGFIDITDAEERVTNRTKAIMPVHFASYVGGMPKVYTFAKKFDLRVVEDAAHSFGCRLKNKLIGSFGDVVCFSFDGIKNITSGEGGAVVTKDLKVIEKVNDSRLLGVIGDTKKRFSGSRSWSFDVTKQGWRYHMSDLMAAIGRTQLRKSNEMFKRRKEIREAYFQAFRSISSIELYNIENDNTEVVPHIFPIKVEYPDKLIEYLLLHGIQAGKHYQPNHALTFYKQSIHLPNVNKISSMNVSLPIHPGVTDSDLKLVINSVLEFYSEN